MNNRKLASRSTWGWFMSLPVIIEVAMEDAIDFFVRSLRCDFCEADTHDTLIILGWNDNEESRRSIARYLVGLRALAIDAALTIRSQLEDTPDDRLEIARNVYAIVGKNNFELTDEQIRSERNPWISEGIWHLCMVVASRRQELHPIGSILSVDYAHVASKDHGFDVLAMYEDIDTLFGLTIVESKAYKDDPNGAIANSVEFYREIDCGEHDLQLRQSVQIMRTALPLSVQEKISGSFWKRKRSYIPNPHYDKINNVNWRNSRPSFRSLVPKKPNIIIMPHIIKDFDIFFDLISDEMRYFVKGQ